MISEFEKALGVSKIDEKYYCATNIVLTDKVFDDGIIRAQVEPGQLRLSDIHITNCQFRGIDIGRGVRLENVIFDDLKITSSFEVSAHSSFNNVKFIGMPNLSSLWIRRNGFINSSIKQKFDFWIEQQAKDVDVMIDISELECSDISIYGIPVDKVKIDKDRQFILKRSRFNKKILASQGIVLSPFWSNRITNLPTPQGSAIYSLPSKKSKYFSVEQVLDEKKALDDLGYFDEE